MPPVPQFDPVIERACHFCGLDRSERGMGELRGLVGAFLPLWGGEAEVLVMEAVFAFASLERPQERLESNWISSSLAKHCVPALFAEWGGLGLPFALNEKQRVHLTIRYLDRVEPFVTAETGQESPVAPV